MEIHLGIKKDTMLLSGNCIELEKNEPDSEKQILNVFFHMWDIHLEKRA
jgi:hypothetical protein